MVSMRNWRFKKRDQRQSDVQHLSSMCGNLSIYAANRETDRTRRGGAEVALRSCRR